MQRFKASSKYSTLEAIIYPILILTIMWSVFAIDRSFELSLYKYGVKPSTLEGLKGIIFMPFIHGQNDFSHIINNSIPTAILLGTLIYFYRSVAIYVVLFVWLGGGLLLWAVAQNTGSYHIGMSGILYGLFGFLLVSGFLRKYLPLQAISLFVVFIYGSLVWGIFPTEERISWEGHLFGLLVGIITAFSFRYKGPTPPKYRYEIEKELGIPPPELERIWMEKNGLIHIASEEQNNNLDSSSEENKKENKSIQNKSNVSSTGNFQSITYFIKKEK